MAGAPSPTPSPESPPPTSLEGTKMALALSVIFILCIFGTAFGARRFIRHRQVDVGHSVRYQRGRRHHHHHRQHDSNVSATRSRSRMTRAWREMQINAAHSRTTVTSNTRPAGRRADHRAWRGMAEDKIARFSVVSFHDAEYRHVDGDHDIEAQHETPRPEERPRCLADDNARTPPLLSRALTMVSKSWTAQTNAPSSTSSAHQSLPAEASSRRCNCCCSICTEDLANGVHVRRLPCGHVFHPSCIDEWLRNRAPTCPLW